jgi:hypothetical protein
MFTMQLDFKDATVLAKVASPLGQRVGGAI